MTTFVEMYHPALGNVRVLVAEQAVDDYEARGWMLVDGNAPAPVDIYLTPGIGDLRYLKLGDVGTPGTATGDQLRADFVARADMPVFHAAHYGVVADGSDQAANLRSAWTDTQAARGILVLPRGDIGYGSAWATITDRAGIIGYGKRHTRLHPVGGYSGDAISITDAWWNSTEDYTNTAPGALGTNTSGVFLRGFSIEADRANPARGIITHSRVDNLQMEDVGLYYIAGRALSLGAEDTLGLIREARFDDCTVRGCGTATDPAVIISAGTTVADATNQLTFNTCEIIFPWGVGLSVLNTRSDAAIRRLTFNTLMLHGQYTYATVGADLAVFEGDIEDVTGYIKTNGSVNVGGTPYAALRFKPNTTSGKRPALIDLKVAMRAMNGDGIAVDGADSIRLTGMSSPGSIVGNEVTFGANSTARAIVDIVANGARKFSIDSTVTSAVFGTADVLDVEKFGTLALLNRGADPAQTTGAGLLYTKSGAPFYRHPAGDGSIYNLMIGRRVVKAANNLLAVSSTALVTDPELTLSLVAGKEFEVEAHIIADGPTTADLLIGFTAAAGSTFDWTPNALITSTSAASGSVVLSAKAVTDTAGAGLAGVGTKTVTRIKGRLVTGGSAGSSAPFAIQFAQVTSDPGQVTIYAGSYMRVTRIG